MSKEFDYEKMIKIDPYNLDKEWQEQASNVFVCMQALAQARKELDMAKEAYDLTVAEVDRDIRDSSDKKPSEKAIEGMVLMDEQVQKAKEELVEAKYNVNLLEAARAGLENKREALTNLVKLHGMSYYAEPSADIEARGQLEDMRQEAVRSRVKINPAPVRRKK